MPWRESSVLEQRIEFVVMAHRREHSMKELCETFGISRKTGYTWLKRYEAEGSRAMQDRSRRPKYSPRQTDSEIEATVVALRKERPDWGAPKLRYLLVQQRPDWGSISERTVHRILKRHELIEPAVGRRPAPKRFERGAPNELWQMDFKGPQGFNKGSPVGPLAIEDDHSRFLLALKHLGSTKLEGVRDTLQETFECAGVPEAMLMDHGTPWWNPISPWGMTELTVWIMRQGIRVIRSGVMHPQTQGKVERGNGSLQRAVNCRGGNPEDQAWLDMFSREYNFIRPHEALGMVPPATRWKPSTRPFQPVPPEWSYPASMETVRVTKDGRMQWGKRRWDVSAALRGQLMGIEVVGDRALVYFCKTAIRELDLKTGKSCPIPSDVIYLLGKQLSSGV